MWVKNGAYGISYSRLEVYLSLCVWQSKIIKGGNMKIKNSVSLRGLSPQMAIACIVIEMEFNEYGVRPVITSGCDSVHGKGSRHYSGQALDFRTRDVNSDDMVILALNIKQSLGPQFDVVLESNHLHVEFDPK